MIKNLFKEYMVSTELIKHMEDDPAVLEIDKIHEKIISYINKNLIYKTSGKVAMSIGDEDAWLLNKDKGIISLLNDLAKVLYKRFGLTVTVTPTFSPLNACTIPFYVRETNVLSKLEGYPYIDKLIQGKLQVLKKMIDNPNLRKGTIDHTNAKISGPLSIYINSLMVDYPSFIKVANFTARELTAIVLHEVGHMFTYMQTAVRTDRTNQILNDIANSIKNNEPAGKREYLLINLLNEGMLTDKEVKELAKEERPIILSTKLFSFIYKHYVDVAISLQYTQTSAETLADNFSAKFGYAKELASGLKKMNDIWDKYGYIDPRERYEEIVVPFSIWYLIMYTTMSILSIIPGLIKNLTQFVYKIQYDIHKRMYMVYDTDKYRIKRIMQVYIDRLKDNKLNKKQLYSTITDIRQIENIMNSYKDDDEPVDWINKAVLYFSSETRNIEQELHIERVLEELANNNLFVSAKELRYSKEDFFRPLFNNDKKEDCISLEGRRTPKREYYEEDRLGYDKVYKKVLHVRDALNTKSITLPTVPEFSNTAQSTIIIADKAKITDNTITIGSKTLMNLLTGARYEVAKSILDYSILDKSEPYMLKFIDSYLEYIDYDDKGNFKGGDKFFNALGRNIEDFCRAVFGFKEYAYGIDRLGIGYNLTPSIAEKTTKSKIKLVIEGDFTKNDVERLYNIIFTLKPLVEKFKKKDVAEVYDNKYTNKHRKYARDKWLKSIIEKFKDLKSKDVLTFIVNESTIYTWGYANNMYGYVMHYLNMIYLTLSAIERKMTKKVSTESITLSLELIKDFNNDPFGPELDKVHDEIKKIVLAIPDEHEMRRMLDQGVLNPYLAKIENIVKKRLGISIALCSFPDMDFAFCIPYYIRPDMVLMTSEESKDVLSNKVSARRFSRTKYLSEGHIDYDKCFISGAISNYNHIVSMDYFALFKCVHCSSREVTGVLLHELGHLFTYIDMGYRTDKTNQILNHMSNSLLNNEPASKRSFLIADLEKLNMMDEDLLKDIAKEERPLIASLNIFRALFKKATNVSISNDYVDTSAEVVADDFATKFGYGQDIAYFLHKTERMFGPKKLITTDLRVWFWMISYLVIGFTFFSSFPLSAGFLVGSSIALIGKVVDRLKRGYMDVFFNKMDINYDIMITRLKRIKRTIMNMFKVKHIPKENLDNLLATLNKLETMILDYEDDDEPSIVARIVNLFDMKRKKKLEEKEIELLLEELASNKLFVATHIFNKFKG